MESSMGASKLMMEELSLDKHSPKELRIRGNQAYSQGCLKEAKLFYTLCIECINSQEDLGKELKYTDDLLLAMSNRAQVHLGLQLFDLALLDATQALLLDPTHVKSIFRKAKALYALGAHEQAVSCLAVAMRQNEHNLANLQKEAKALLVQGRMHIFEDEKQRLFRCADGYQAVIHPKNLGSGRDGCPLVTPMCANKACLKDAARHNDAQICKTCYLVSYCSSKCRKRHAKEHRKMCNLVPSRWMPIKAQDHEELASSIFLWGNVPAISLLSPGMLPSMNLKLCFAASGDIRDMLTTISQLPKGYSGNVHVVINDYNSQVLMRNFMILEMLRCYGKDAIDCVIAMWYSDAMTPVQSKACRAAGWEALKRSGFLERSAATIAACRSWSALRGPPLVATFKGVLSTLCVDIEDRNWMFLMKCLEICDVPPSTIKEARLRRCMSMYARFIENIFGPLRVAWCQFHCHNGLMLPFSSAMDPHFTATNMFLLDPLDQNGWPQNSMADPLCGWHYKDMECALLKSGVPCEDLYGALFFHLRETLMRFIEVMESNRVEIELFDHDARLLAENFKKSSDSTSRFHAISTSNIADNNFVGLKQLLSDWGPLLASNGTLITMQMQWFQEDIKLSDLQSIKEMGEIVEKCMKKTLGTGMEADAKGMVKAMIQRLVDSDRRKHADEYPVHIPETLMISMCTRTDIAYAKHLSNGGIQQAAEYVRLKMRSTHLYVPARIGIPLDARPSAAPVNHFSSLGELEHAMLRKSNFMERYIEWTTLSL